MISARNSPIPCPPLIALAFAASVAILTAAEPAYTPVPDFPQLPTDLELGAATGVEMDREGNLLVFHRNKTPILVLTPEGKFLRSFGADFFDSAHGLRCDPEGAIWTTDNKNHTVIKFSPVGEALLTLGKRDVEGADTSHFNKPADIAFAKNGNIFIADGYGNSRVVRTNPKGEFEFAWGEKGSGKSQFDLPHAIRIDSKGLVYVGDRENDRIQVFDQNGKFIRLFGGFAPFGMHITPDDRLFIADGRANEVLVMTLEGEILHRFGSKGSKSGQFNMPHGIAVDKDGAIYVAEVNNKRIQKFVLK